MIARRADRLFVHKRFIRALCVWRARQLAQAEPPVLPQTLRDVSTVAAQEISDGRLTRPFNARIGVVALGGLVAVATTLDLGAGSSRELVVNTPAGFASALGLVTGVTAAGDDRCATRAPLESAIAREPQAATWSCRSSSAAAALALNYGCSACFVAGIHDTAGLKVFGAVTALAIPFANLLGSYDDNFSRSTTSASSSPESAETR
jgi:DNA-directed RNA polymerase subunit K/omega